MKYVMPASFLNMPNEEDRMKIEADEEPPERSSEFTHHKLFSFYSFRVQI